MAAGIGIGFAPSQAYASVPAGYEPTIRAEFGGGNPARTRDDFISRCTGAPRYFNGRLYADRAEFFDAHHGSVFTITQMPRHESMERFNLPTVWRATLRAGEVSQPVRIDGGVSTPAPTPVPAPVQTPAPQLPQVTPVPPVNVQPPANNDTPSQSDRGIIQRMEFVNRNQEISYQYVAVRMLPEYGDTTMPLNRWTFLTSVELAAWAEVVPTHQQTRSAMTIPNRRITDAELDAWIAEYYALGGINAYELEIVRLINEVRVEHGLHALIINPELSMAARFHSQDMIDNNFFSHGGPAYNHGGRTYRARMFGCERAMTRDVSECIVGSATGSRTPQQHVEWWMNSPGHMRAILHEDSISIGIGRVGGITTAKFGR